MNKRSLDEFDRFVEEFNANALQPSPSLSLRMFLIRLILSVSFIDGEYDHVFTCASDLTESATAELAGKLKLPSTNIAFRITDASALWLSCSLSCTNAIPRTMYFCELRQENSLTLSTGLGGDIYTSDPATL